MSKRLTPLDAIFESDMEQDPTFLPDPEPAPPAETKSAPAEGESVGGGFIAPPPPGVYRGVDFETYTRWDALNHSTLKRIDPAFGSPAHYKHDRDNRVDRDTPSKKFGRAEHLLTLEPDRLSACLITDEPPRHENGQYKGQVFGPDSKKFKEWLARYPPGMVYLSDDEKTRLLGLHKALLEHEDAGPLIRAPGESELCMVWDCPVTGERCKARVDKRIPGVVRADLKTCLCASDLAIAASWIDYGYHTSDAFYRIGAEVLGLEKDQLYIFGESQPPFQVSVRKVGRETAFIAKFLVQGWLKTVAACKSAGLWPGYPVNEKGRPVKGVEAPHYYLARFADAEV